MQITRQADYAVRAVLYLAKIGSDKRASTSQIAQEQQIPPSFLAKIVSQLSVILDHFKRFCKGVETRIKDIIELYKIQTLSIEN